jgi:hypothetical protein
MSEDFKPYIKTELDKEDQELIAGFEQRAAHAKTEGEREKWLFAVKLFSMPTLVIYEAPGVTD